MSFVRRLPAARGEIALLFAAIGIVALVAASQVLTSTSFGRYRTLSGLVSSVKQVVTESHVWLEERLSGDTGIDVQGQVHRPLLLAASNCRLLLTGGTSSFGPVEAISDPLAREVVGHLCSGIDNLHDVASERLAAASGAGVGTEIDTRFDTLFTQVISLSDDAGVALDHAVQSERDGLAILNAVIAVLVAVLLLTVAGVLGRYRRASERTHQAHIEAGLDAERILTDAQRDAKRAAILNRLADRVTYAKGEADLVSAATAALSRLVPSDSGDVLLLNSSQDRLMVAASWGNADHVLGRPAAVDAPDLCPGIRRGGTYALDDASDDLSVMCDAHPSSSGSMLCVPMLALGKAVGVIHVGREGIAAFDATSQQLAGRVAEQVALGLANARLLTTMERLAMADPLTGLHNARFFDPLMDRELANVRRDGIDVSVVMIDIDHFKQFNDAHGHPGGDEALKAFTRAAKAALRESDTLARYGGEEFALLLRKTDLETGTKVADKIRVAIEDAVVDLGPNRTAKITVSMGVASTSAHGTDRMTLMRLADDALYAAKQAGRNQVVAAPVSGPVSPVSPVSPAPPASAHPLAALPAGAPAA